MKGAWIALSARYGTALLLVVLAAVGPFPLSQFNLLQLSSFAAMGLATLGLALAWGYVGILSFGHAAFFGLGAYAYAIAAINFGDSTLAIGCSAAGRLRAAARSFLVLRTGGRRLPRGDHALRDPHFI
jgi:ABC-type branched-subunit amino acid transport system permease subunit